MPIWREKPESRAPPVSFSPGAYSNTQLVKGDAVRSLSATASSAAVSVHIVSPSTFTVSVAVRLELTAEETVIVAVPAFLAVKTPLALTEAMQSDEPGVSERALAAMLTMQRIDVAAIERAVAGE